MRRGDRCTCDLSDLNRVVVALVVVVVHVRGTEGFRVGGDAKNVFLRHGTALFVLVEALVVALNVVNLFVFIKVRVVITALEVGEVVLFFDWGKRVEVVLDFDVDGRLGVFVGGISWRS